MVVLEKNATIFYLDFIPRSRFEAYWRFPVRARMMCGVERADGRRTRRAACSNLHLSARQGRNATSLEKSWAAPLDPLFRFGSLFIGWWLFAVHFVIKFKQENNIENT